MLIEKHAHRMIPIWLAAVFAAIAALAVWTFKPAGHTEKAGVILGLEDEISAEDNVRIMERSRSKTVLVYYDVGNSTRMKFDVVKEIRWLGQDRICQMHLKDNPHYMGEGSIPFPEVVRAMRDIGFAGYANLETETHPAATVEADMRRNLAFIRKTMEQV